MRRLRVILALLALIGAAVLSGNGLLAQEEPAGTEPAANQPAQATVPAVSSRAATINGQSVGEVLIGDNVVLRLREPAGGYTPAERANIVAQRLASLLNQGYTWQDLQVGTRNNETVLLLGDNTVVTVDERHAQANNTTPTMLAYQWAGQMQTALRQAGAPVVAGTEEHVATTTTNQTTTTTTATAQQWPSWTNPATKIVPIVAAGTPGIGLGFAQVTGPQERVNDVRAVVQISAEFERTARIIAFVPSNTTTGLNRVQGVAVTALLQYQLFRF